MNLPILEFLFQCYFLYKRHTHFSTLSVYTVIFNPIIITWYTLYTTINCTPFYIIMVTCYHNCRYKSRIYRTYIPFDIHIFFVKKMQDIACIFFSLFYYLIIIYRIIQIFLYSTSLKNSPLNISA